MKSISSKITPKMVLIGLGLVVLVEILVGVAVLRQQVLLPSADSDNQLNYKGEGRIILGADKDTYSVGETLTITVNVITDDKSVVGTDLVLHYNPNILEASASGIKKGTIYPEYPLTSIDPALGTIRISGITVGDGFKGSGLFATIDLKAKSAGQTSLSVEFQPGLTTDSNMVEQDSSKDILDKVQNLKLTII